MCFNDCSGLASITIPNSVTSVSTWCFNGGTYPIYCYENLYAQLKSEYGKRVILIDTPSGIEDITTANTAPAIKSFYDLTGRGFNAKQHGVNIVRYTDGTTRKIMVK